MNARFLTTALAGVVLMATGCSTMGGGSQMQNTIVDTHRRVANIEKNIEGSVNRLNESTAELLARVDASDQQVKALQGTVEENSVRLQALSKNLETLTSRLYQERGFSTGTRVTTPSEVGGGPVRVLPPGAQPEPDGMSLMAPVPPAGAAVPPAGAAVPPAAPAVPPAAAIPPTAAVPPAAPAAPPVAAAPAAASSGSPEEDYQKAQRSFAEQNFPAALEQFSGYLQRYPNSDNASNAQFWKAKSLQSMEQYAQAIAEFEALRNVYANSVKVPYAMHQQAVCHSRLGQSERAIELFQQVIKDFPTTPAADQAKSDLKKLQGKQ